MLTLNLFEASDFAEASTCSQAVSPVRTWQASTETQTGLQDREADSGTKCTESSANVAPGIALSKMCLTFGVVGWKPFSRRLPTSGIARNGIRFPLPMQAHRTAGAGFSLLPTPTASQNTKKIRCLAPSEAAGTHGVMLIAAIGHRYPQMIGQYLNPQKVEWMMGYPEDWTKIE